MYKPLSQKAVEQIHAGSLELLADVGIEVASQQAKNIYCRHGAEIKGDKRVLKTPNFATLA
jgi:trimethylamine:corrinoid methyltransferase-like protein